MHVGGREDDDEGRAAARSGEAQRAAEAIAASDFVREVVGRIAFELAATPEGRAAGLSVEVWPAQGVWLRVRAGHELRVLVETREEGSFVAWERIDPSPRTGRAHATQGTLGPARSTGAGDVQKLVARWLSLRVGG